MDSKKVGVLFSGGRDSSLTSCLLALRDYKIHLITCYNGATVNTEISNYRHNELLKVFPDNIVERITIPVYALFRELALANIESDFQRYKTSHICMGCKLAMYTEGLLYCLENDIRLIAGGCAKYQNHYPEQLEEVIMVIQAFLNEYGVQFINPVFDYETEDDVKYKLFRFGLSTKSLEGSCLFGDTYSVPEVEKVLQYIDEKLPICREYITFKKRGG